MARVGPNTPYDRAQELLDGMHPKLNGDLIATPVDLLEGEGNFTEVDERGNPKGFELGRVDVPNGRSVYIGLSPDTTTRQNTSPLPYRRSSFLASQPLVDSHAPVSPLTAAKIPRAAPPVLKKVLAAVSGYPASSPEHPYWYSWTYSRGDGGHSPLSPPVSFQVAQGQSIRVPLPEDVSGGATHVGIWLSEPGTSTYSTTGRMRLQREVDLRSYRIPTYDLTGPYRFGGRPAPEFDETALGQPSPPGFRFEIEQAPSHVGTYYFRVTFTRGEFESISSVSSGPLVVTANPFYGDENPAGYGRFKIFRPNPPPGATGWHAYVLVDSQWYRVWSKSTDKGRVAPFQLTDQYVQVAGWSGNEDYAKNEDTILISSTPPEADTTSLPYPDAAPKPPEAFGASVPPPGKYYVRVADSVDGREGRASEARPIDIGYGETLRVIFSHPVNLLINAEHSELGPNGLPMDHTIVTTGGFVSVESGALVIETNGPQTGATPTVKTDSVSVDRTKTYGIGARISYEPPSSGVPMGSFETVLEEANALGISTLTVLGSSTSIGVIDFFAAINPAGSSTGLSWRNDTVSADLFFRFVGTTKNGKARISQKMLKLGSARPRRNIVTAEVGVSHPDDPTATLPLGAGGGAGPPPAVLLPPETYTVSGADRPTQSAFPLESISFGPTLPSDWTPYTLGGSIVETSTSAAIAGTHGLRFKDAGTSVSSLAVLRKNYYPGGASSMGLATRNRVYQMPAGGTIKFHALERPSDNTPLAWFQIGNTTESIQLRIDSSPILPGNVVIVLNGVATSVSVIAVRESATLTLTQNPVRPGTVWVNTGVDSYSTQVGGTQKVIKLQILEGAKLPGYVGVTLDGYQWLVPVSQGNFAIRKLTSFQAKLEPGEYYVWDNRGFVAYEIAHYPFTGGWDIYGGNDGVNEVVYFVSQSAGPRPDLIFDPRQTGVVAQVTTITEGSAETKEQLAARIRSTPMPGWTVSGSANQVTFTSVIAGSLGDIVYDPGNTGATGSVVTTAQGTADTPQDLATRISQTSFPGWNVTRSGSTVTFTSQTSGPKIAGEFYRGLPRVAASMITTRQGTNTELTVHVRNGATILSRRILPGLTTNSLFDLDASVDGAGTTNGVIQVWAAFGGGTKALVGRWENLDLSSYPVGVAAVGVISEESPSLTWELHSDEVMVTERGLNFVREISPTGELINQIYSYFLPSQPARQDLLIQDKRLAVLPENSYTMSAWLRHAEVVGSAKPISVTAFRPDGTSVALGDVTGDSGISGSADWDEYERTYLIPAGCYEVSLDSRDIGAGEFVIQELVFSPGLEAKRAIRYATNGSSRTTLDIGSLSVPGMQNVRRKRILLETDAEIPSNVALVTSYRSAPSKLGPWSPFTADPSSVPDNPFVQAEVTFSGDGLVTPLIKSGTPRAEYALIAESREIGTLLKEDHTELPGGTAFFTLEEWSSRPEIGVTELPGGRIERQELYPPVDYLPASVIQVFTPEARKYLEERWGKEIFVVTTGGLALKVKLRPPVEFTRQAGSQSRDGRFALYVASLAPAQIIAKQPFARPL